MNSSGYIVIGTHLSAARFYLANTTTLTASSTRYKGDVGSCCSKHGSSRLVTNPEPFSKQPSADLIHQTKILRGGQDNTRLPNPGLTYERSSQPTICLFRRSSGSKFDTGHCIADADRDHLKIEKRLRSLTKPALWRWVANNDLRVRSL